MDFRGRLFAICLETASAATQGGASRKSNDASAAGHCVWHLPTHRPLINRLGCPASLLIVPCPRFHVPNYDVLICAAIYPSDGCFIWLLENVFVSFKPVLHGGHATLSEITKKPMVAAPCGKKLDPVG